MDPDAYRLQKLRLQAFDLSERTVRRSRASAVRRADRLRARSFMIAQTAVTAGLAWSVARYGIGHPLPFFAPVAVIITLGISFGQRMRRAVEVAIGVTVGVAVGEAFQTLFGTGVWQIMVVCALSMSLATLLGAGQLMIIQSGVQAIVVTSLASNVDYGFDRWLDAVIGCALALIMATIAPGSPLRAPGRVAGTVLEKMAATLDAAVAALRTNDATAADAVLAQARAVENDLTAFDQAASEGVAVVRHSPFRRRQLTRVTALADLSDPLDHASRNLRVLARRCAVAAWRDEDVPMGHFELMDRLSGVCRFMATELEQGRLPHAARDRLLEIGRSSSHLELTHAISAVVILAQIRSLTTDLLELTGMDYAEARELIPDMD